MRQCRWCDAPIPPKPPGQRGRAKVYCSVKCRVASTERRGYQRTYDKDFDRSPKPCERCGTQFVPVRRVQRFCSRTCRNLAANRLRRGGEGDSNYYRTLFLLERGGGCVRCGGEDDLQVHHIVAVKDGGEHTPANVEVLCFDCHKREHGGASTPRLERSPKPQVVIENAREVIAGLSPRPVWGGVGGRPPVQKRER